MPLVCHEDTWSVLTQVSAFELDKLDADRITRLEGRLVEIELSGLNLVTILEVTADYDRLTSKMKVKQLYKPAGALNIANRLRAEIAAALHRVGPEGDSPIPAIRLDDKATTGQ